jgi:hypothetical protein
MNTYWVCMTGNKVVTQDLPSYRWSVLLPFDATDKAYPYANYIIFFTFM